MHIHMYIYTYIIATSAYAHGALLTPRFSTKSKPKVEPVACVWSFTEAGGNSPTHMRSVSCICRTKAWVRSAVWKVRISSEPLHRSGAQGGRSVRLRSVSRPACGRPVGRLEVLVQNKMFDMYDIIYIYIHMCVCLCVCGCMYVCVRSFFHT